MKLFNELFFQIDQDKRNEYEGKKNRNKYSLYQLNGEMGLSIRIKIKIKIKLKLKLKSN